MTRHPGFVKLTTFDEVVNLSAGKILERSASLSPAKAALVHKGKRMTYEELNRSVDTLASGISSLGITKGDRVVIDLPNCPEFQ